MPKTKINIELVHDVVCSWCPIGYSYVKVALEQLEQVNRVLIQQDFSDLLAQAS